MNDRTEQNSALEKWRNWPYHCAVAVLFFVEGTLLPGSNDLRHLSSGLRHLFVFLLFGTLCPRQRSFGLEGAGGPVGFEPVARGDRVDGASPHTLAACM